MTAKTHLGASAENPACSYGPSTWVSCCSKWPWKRHDCMCEQFNGSHTHLGIICVQYPLRCVCFLVFRTWRWFLFPLRPLGTSSRATATLFCMWVPAGLLISQGAELVLPLRLTDCKCWTWWCVFVFLHSHHQISLNKNSGQSSDIHYWIGNTSSQDEQGAAAIYVTQMDEHLGGSPVQHREVQGSESPRFRGYFKNGVMWVQEWELERESKK